MWTWIGDIADRIESDIEGANYSWKTAQGIYLTLPPGEGDEELESALFQARVKLDRFT